MSLKIFSNYIYIYRRQDGSIFFIFIIPNFKQDFISDINTYKPTYTETMKQRNFFHHITFYSSTSSCPKIFWSIHILVFLITTTNALVKLPQNTTITALLVFGDSIVDAGNNNDMFVLARCNYLPYGIDFEDGVPTGRFSNGKVPTDILGSPLSLSLFILSLNHLLKHIYIK